MAISLTKIEFSETVIASRRRSNPIALTRLLQSLHFLAMTSNMLSYRIHNHIFFVLSVFDNIFSDGKTYS